MICMKKQVMEVKDGNVKKKNALKNTESKNNIQNNEIGIERVAARGPVSIQ